MRQPILWLAWLAAVILTAGPTNQSTVEYGRPGGHALLLDLRVPPGPGPFPAAILVHGGGFDSGSRATNMAPLFEPLADAGFAWFSIDYRMAPEFRFPQAREDVNAAIRWVKANAALYHVNPDKIVLAGESAGGYLVNYAGTHETPETSVAAVVDIYGPTDYEKIARQRQAYPARFNMASISAHQQSGGSIWFFGVEGYDEPSFATLRAVSPLHAVHKGMPPFLAIHGTRDDQVPYEQSTLLCEAMHAVGARCDIVTLEAGGHGMSTWTDADQQHYKGGDGRVAQAGSFLAAVHLGGLCHVFLLKARAAPGSPPGPGSGARCASPPDRVDLCIGSCRVLC